ncbi:hypothetical protein [Micromonospora sp. SH-82]|uniref:hypothetical protein n=1 Tax=Micromonospora sp. SH-82 TaxID=3132938 RepID=UPI003EB8112C
MRTVGRMTGFVLGLVGVFGAAYGVGHLVGPIGPPAAVEHQHGGHDGDPGGPVGGTPGGLLVSEQGYTLDPVTAPPGEFAFRITGPDGQAVTGYDVNHDRPMHLIVARRDLSGFRHVHPRLSEDGTWRLPTPMGEPGTWRAFADFQPTGADPLTLGVDVTVPGPVTPTPLPPPTRTVAVDGYDVTLDGGLRPGHDSRLTLTVSRDGVPVTDLEPYLGAYGHLVALRQGDLAYLHAHPEGTPGDGRTPAGPEVTFHVAAPSPGTYRLYLDFQHGGTVRTAEFTVVAPHPDGPAPTGSATDGPPATTASAEPDDGHGSPGHRHD